MNSNQAQQLIQRAQEVLWNNPFDQIHDLFHHYRVWENAVEIVYIEQINCYMNLLEVCVWWHDISKSDINNLNEDNFIELDKAFKDFGIENKEQELIKQTILEHQSIGIQKSNESKILFDADKIEYSSIPRIFVAKKSLTDEVRIQYENKWRKNMEERYKGLNFEYSKKIFKERLENLQNFGKDLFLQPELLNVKI